MDSEFIQRQKDDFFRDLSALGSVWAYLLAVIFFVIWEENQLAKKLIVGLALIYGVVILIRAFYFKQRPNRLGYSSFIGKIDASSFPSQHSARISFISIALIANYNNLIFNIVVAFIAVLVIYSRVYLKKHYFIDVVAGAVVGAVVYLFGMVFF